MVRDRQRRQSRLINYMVLKSIDALWEKMIEHLSDRPKRKSAGGRRKFKGQDAVKALLNGLNSKWYVCFRLL